jgi:hypothetical protein
LDSAGFGLASSTRFGFVILLLSVGSLEAIAQTDKTDVVVMTNGDRLVGEIKLLEYGQLEFKASYMESSVHLDWAKVTQLESTRRFRVEFDDGSLYSGSIHKSASAAPSADFLIDDAGAKTTRGFLEVVNIQPLEGSVWHRFRGSADFGLTLHPEAGQNQWSANASVDYPSEKFRVMTRVSSLFGKQEESEDAERHSLGMAYYQYLSRNWFLFGMNQLLNDSQLDLELRVTLGAGGGHFLARSNRAGLTAFAGVAATHEKYFEAASNGTNSEAILGTEFYWARFASSQVSSRLLFYSGISQWGRMRVDWESSISWEIWKDTFWKISVLENFDSRPPEGLPSNDFALTSTFGFTF